MSVDPMKHSIIPQHVAIIMDGNRRWAQKESLPINEGYVQGAQTALRIAKRAKSIGIKYLTLYAFSLENWNRPSIEVDCLMHLLYHYLSEKIENIVSEGIRVIFIGKLTKLSPQILKLIRNIEEKSKHNLFIVTIAFSYSGRDEIRQAALEMTKFFLSSDVKIREIAELAPETFDKFINSHNVPDPDLLIRTGNRLRLSNFLLWQLAYSELYFSEKFWPDFDEESFASALAAFSLRERNEKSKNIHNK